MTYIVKTRLYQSPIEGLGVFAAEDIPEGTVVWRYNPAIDRMLTAGEIAALDENEREFMERYAYLDTRLGLYVLSADNARFCNHSDNANTRGAYPADGPVGGIDIAVRDIKAGEEITCDYRSFDADASVKLG